MYLQNWTDTFTDAINTPISNPNVSDNELKYLLKRYICNQIKIMELYFLIKSGGHSLMKNIY